MKRILILLFVVIILTTVSAETFKQNTEVDFKKTCTNSSDTVCSSAAYCNVTVKYPDSTYSVNNLQMTNNNNGIFNYTFTTSNINQLGLYNWDIFCCDGSDCGESHGDFSVTKTGVILSQDKALVYMGMMFTLIFVFVMTLIAIFFLPAKNTRDENFSLQINHLKYLRTVLLFVAYGLLIAVIFTASNISFLYLETTMMGNLFFKTYQVLGWMLIPIIPFFFIKIFVDLYEDNETKKMLERGVQL